MVVEGSLKPVRWLCRRWHCIAAAAAAAARRKVHQHAAANSKLQQLKEKLNCSTRWLHQLAWLGRAGQRLSDIQCKLIFREMHANRLMLW